MNHTIYTDHSLDEEETIIPDTLYEVDYDVSALATVDNLDGKLNLLIDTLHEMGYGDDKDLANTLIERNVIDFDYAEYTSHVMNCLIDHYGEDVLSGSLVTDVIREGLTTELRNANEHNWRSLIWESLKKFVPYIIVDEIQSLGLNVAHGPTLQAYGDMGRLFSQVKRNLLIDYGVELGYHLPDYHLPHVDIVIYHPDTCKVLAIVSGKVTSDRIHQTIKLSQAEGTKHIKVYLLGPDEDDILSDNDPSEKGAAIIESGLDRSYILTGADTEDSEKVKRFEQFIEDLKEAVSSDSNRDALSDAS